MALTFKKHENDGGDHLKLFFEVVEKVIKSRRALIGSSSAGETVSGRYLFFDPSATMYDGLAEEQSSGFFDSDDTPPPEFWIGAKDGLLISFVPLEFISLADNGVINSMSESIEWSGDNITVDLES